MDPTRPSLPDVLAGVPWDGEVAVDDNACDEMAQDFGRIVRQRPRAVLRTGSADDVAAAVRIAGEHGVPVAARGMGHSTFGQSQVLEGIVIDMRSLARIGPIDSDTVTVEAGASWRSVLAAVLPHGLTPPVLTDYLGLTVGGTLSVGGIGGTSHRYGAQTDHVTHLEVVTGDGTLCTCSPSSRPDLFQAVLAGLGQHGIITRATLRLVPAPTRVRRYKLFYPTASALISDQRVLLQDRRFDYVEGEVLADESDWLYMVEAVSYYSPPASPDDDDLLSGLGHTRRLTEIEDLAYVDFADRLAAAEAFLRSTGEWSQPHPWCNAFLPDAATDEFLNQLVVELNPEDLGPGGLILVYPIFSALMTTPLLQMPAAPIVFLVGVLRTSPTTETAVRQAVSDNRIWYDQASSVGGTAYQVGSIPFTRADWINHFGEQWSSFAAADERYDPHQILCPGQGIDTRFDATGKHSADVGSHELDRS
jgi:cytokinin dehydrogenase